MSIFNLKALVTTLVIGSSSAAMAKPVVVLSGEASISVGYNSDAQPVVRDHRYPVPVYQPPVVYQQPVVYQPPVTRPLPTHTHTYTHPVYTQPVVHPVLHQEPFWNPTNTNIGATSSGYIGAYGQGSLNRDWNNQRSWFQLTEPTRIDSGRQFFKFQSRPARFSQIRLQTVGGRTDITQVDIQYTDGSMGFQRIKLGTVLDRRNPMITIGIAGDSRNIKKITVHGTSYRGSAYQLLAI